MLENKLDIGVKKTDPRMLKAISDSWFVRTSAKLLEGSFKYPSQKKLFDGKPYRRKKTPSITNLKIKVVEKALLNAIEPRFEGYCVWVTISEEEYKAESVNSSNKLNFKLNNSCYEKKKTVCPTVFSPHSYGFRPQKSAHQALKKIKH